MRHDDDMVRRCGVWGCGILTFAGIAALLLATLAIGIYATDGDIR